MCGCVLQAFFLCVTSPLHMLAVVCVFLPSALIKKEFALGLFISRRGGWRGLLFLRSIQKCNCRYFVSKTCLNTIFSVCILSDFVLNILVFPGLCPVSVWCIFQAKEAMLLISKVGTCACFISHAFLCVSILCVYALDK